MAVVHGRVEKIEVRCHCGANTCPAKVTVSRVGTTDFGVETTEVGGKESYVLINRDGLQELHDDIGKMLADG